MKLTDLAQLNWQMLLAANLTLLISRSLIFISIPLLWSQTSKWAAQRQIIKHKPISFVVFLQEISSGIFLLFIDSVVTVVLLKTGVLNITQNYSLSQFVVVFVSMFVWVEIYFYYSHRVLHHPKLFWIHRAHHQGAPLSPLTSLSFSLIERLILLSGAVVLPAVLSIWVPLPAEAFVSYFFLNYFLNVLGHVNVEIFSPRFVNSWAGRFFYTPTFHALHHIRYKGHFGLFTSFLDKSNGTYFKDYPEFHENIVSQAAQRENAIPSQGETIS